MSINRTNPILNYPSPSEVKIYIGEGSWVDDAYRIDYTVTNPRTPLYDYTSQFYKAVAEGHSIVQGQLVINYRFPGYLRHAIMGDLEKDPGVLRSIEQASNVFEDLARGSAADKVRKLMGYKKLGAMKSAKQISNIMHGQHYNEPVNLNEGSLSQRPMPPFKILIKYGGDEALYTKMIKGCYIIGEGQVISASATAGGDMSSSGMPILEVYSFFGRTVEDRIERKAVAASKMINGWHDAAGAREDSMAHKPGLRPTNGLQPLGDLDTFEPPMFR